MKLNRFGINLDEGLALTKETLYKFYVSCFEDNSRKVIDWLKDSTIETPLLLLGGQIGSGKSTLITKVFTDKSLKPDITLKFDKEGLNLDEGDFLSIILSGFIKKAIEQSLDLSFSKLPSEIFKLKPDDWQGIVNILYPEKFSMKLFDKKILARKTIVKHSKYIVEVISKIGDALQNKTKVPLFIFASGIDKYYTGSAAFLSLESAIKILSNYKTMFEVNAVHLFLPDITSPFSSNSEKVFIPTVRDNNIIEILNKRMGVYAGPIKKEFELITKWSGGNPRQAIRLLTHYQSARKNKTLDKTGRLANAIKRTTNDLFTYSSKPTFDLIRTILKDKKIESSLLNSLEYKDISKLALYGNWIFITQGSTNGSWPAIVNPLVKAFYKNEKSMMVEPEQKLLSQYAEINEMSSSGLGFNMLEDDSSKKSADKILQDYFSMGIEEPLTLKLTEILDIISAALLSNDRKDRIIVGFKDKKILNAARAYLFAKANSYEYQRFEHRTLLGGKDKEPIKKLEEILDLDTEIFSLEFAGKWTKRQLEILDKYRDNFIDYQMLWWIPLEKLKDYLPLWVQLRELFEFFVLEDELLGSLSVEDIESDLAFYDDLVETEESAEFLMVKNLKIVLEYLKQNKGGENG